MNIDLALEKIYSLKQFHVKLGLENITNLLNHIGNPQNELKSIHVAGSNGKGSTCSFLASILQEAGYKVGLYTSPHFVRFNERIRLDGKMIDDQSIINFLEINKTYIDKESPTFFEITTALAFSYFEENNVDYAIIETGLGGRLDATNTIIPEASVITSISLEHSHILGETLGEIAIEKGGIIKKNIPVFIGNLPDEAELEIKKICSSKNAPLYNIIEFEESNLSSVIDDSRKTGLKGKHQKSNAKLAVQVLSKLFPEMDHKYFSIGIDNVIINSGIQGRYEHFGKDKNVIFDAAHNLEGIEIFIEEFKKEKSNYDECSLIFGAMRDKQIGKMLDLLSPFFDNIYLASTEYERAASAEELFEIANTYGISTTPIDYPEQIVESYLNSNKRKCLVILGSIYLLGQIKKNMNI